MNFTDAATLTGTRRTADGFLVTQARAVRTGIQLYTGAEMGMADKAVVRVYRPEDEVRSPASLQSFSHAPVTMGHPAESVTSDNWKTLAIGEVSTAAKWEDDHISLPLILKDAAAIAAVEAGTRELSAGYTCTIDATPGTTPQGEAYDAVQRSIVINHLAVVPKGRAGTTRIPDAAPWGLAPIVPTADMKGSHMADTLQTVVLGDQAAQVAIADAPKVEAFKIAAAKALTDANIAHDKEIADKDTIIGELRGDLKKAQDAAIKPADLDKLVKDRAALVAVVSTLDATIVVDGKSDADLRKAAVAAKLGDEMVKDASEAEINGMFKAITKDVQADDPVRKALKDSKPGDDLTKVYATRDADLQNAWKTPAAKEA